MQTTADARTRASAGAGAGRSLLVASTGGHLEQLSRLRHRFDPPLGEVEWVTFDDPQARSLLRGEVVHYVPYIPPRGYGQVARGLPAALRLVHHGYDRVISTGAGVALDYLPSARALDVPAHYVESSARADGPSLTGRLVAEIPGVHLYTQYERWAHGRWHYEGSLFDGYRAVPDDRPGRGTAGLVVVSLGTMRTFGFRRAVEALLRVLPAVLAPGAEILWQVGVTDVADLGLPGARTEVPADELHDAVRAADLVIVHAGIGSCLQTLDAGHCPVLLPRRPELHEHVDGHQSMIARELADRELAVSRDPDDLTTTDLVTAMGRRVVAVEQPGRFALEEAA